MLKRIRSWQHRQSRYGKENHDWHDAEILWLHGVVLERARQPSKADPVWLRLARVYKDIARLGESAFLPRCARCAERVLGFAPSWFSVATQLRERAADVSATAAYFRQLALGSDDGSMVSAIQRTSAGEAELSRERSATPRHAATSPNRPKLLAKREAIRKTYRDLEQPATVVELCEQYLKLESTDGVVWAWYGHSLSELGRYGESAGALQTARGLVTTEDTRAFVFQCQGDLELWAGSLLPGCRVLSRSSCRGRWRLGLDHARQGTVSVSGDRRGRAMLSTSGYDEGLPSCHGTLGVGAHSPITISVVRVTESVEAGSDPGVPRRHPRVPCRCRTGDTSAVPGRR
jgi:hypothetical protein